MRLRRTASPAATRSRSAIARSRSTAPASAIALSRRCSAEPRGPRARPADSQCSMPAACGRPPSHDSNSWLDPGEASATRRHEYPARDPERRILRERALLHRARHRAGAGRGHRAEDIGRSNGRSPARAFRHEIELAIATIASERATGAIDLRAMPHRLPAFLHRLYARRVVTAFAPDIVHTHLNPAARRVGQVAQRMGIAHVATMHIRYEKREQSGLDGLICYTQWQKEEIDPGIQRRDDGGASSGFRSRPAALRRESRRPKWRGGAPRGERGRSYDRARKCRPPDAGKGHGRPGAGVPRGVSERGRAVRLVIVGGGPAEQAQALQGAASGDTRIILNGPASDIAPFYRAFDVYVSASRYEPFGLTILGGDGGRLRAGGDPHQGPVRVLTEKSVLWAEPGDVATLAAQLRAAAARGNVRATYDLAPYAAARGRRRRRVSTAGPARKRATGRGIDSVS